VQKVFITTVDLKLARIYPKSAWESNENLFSTAGDFSRIAQDVAFIANLFGAESDIDAQSRVLMPAELRRKLEIEAQSVWAGLYTGGSTCSGRKFTRSGCSALWWISRQSADARNEGIK